MIQNKINSLIAQLGSTSHMAFTFGMRGLYDKLDAKQRDWEQKTDRMLKEQVDKEYERAEANLFGEEAPTTPNAQAPVTPKTQPSNDGWDTYLGKPSPSALMSKKGRENMAQEVLSRYDQEQTVKNIMNHYKEEKAYQDELFKQHTDWEEEEE